MKLDNLSRIDQMRDFLDGAQPVMFTVAISKDERYQFVEQTLKRFAYSHLKGVVAWLKLSAEDRGQVIAS